MTEWPASMACFTLGTGRINITCQYSCVGKDLLVLLTGGRPHLGACVMACSDVTLPGKNSSTHLGDRHGSQEEFQDSATIQPAQKPLAGCPEPYPVFTSQCPGHRDAEPAILMARELAQALGVTVAVAAGIHFDDISRTEITVVMELCHKLTRMIIENELGD